MKRHKTNLRHLRAAAVLAVVSMPFAAHAQSSASSSTSPQQYQQSQRKNIQVMRASNHLGMDVQSSDGERLGDISDFVFNVSSNQPEVSHVIITSGGVLGFGGEARAVPASAIKRENNMLRLQVSSDEFFNAQVLPEDRRGYFTKAENREQIRRTFSGQTSGTGSTTQRQQQNRPGGSEDNQRFLTFTELRNDDIYGSNGDRLGYAVDAWVNLENARAPYFEIDPAAYNPFMRTPVYTRYAIPFASLQRSDNGENFEVNLSQQQLRDADPVSQTEGVRLAESGVVGEKVLQVKVEPRRGQNERRTPAAE